MTYKTPRQARDEVNRGSALPQVYRITMSVGGVKGFKPGEPIDDKLVAERSEDHQIEKILVELSAVGTFHKLWSHLTGTVTTGVKFSKWGMETVAIIEIASPYRHDVKEFVIENLEGFHQDSAYITVNGGSPQLWFKDHHEVIITSES